MVIHRVNISRKIIIESSSFISLKGMHPSWSHPIDFCWQSCTDLVCKNMFPDPNTTPSKSFWHRRGNCSQASLHMRHLEQGRFCITGTVDTQKFIPDTGNKNSYSQPKGPRSTIFHPNHKTEVKLWVCVLICLQVCSVLWLISLLLPLYCVEYCWHKS